MFEESTHTMELERTHPSGAEEWHCPTCGRRFIMQWPPKYKRIVLEPGDEFVTHSGGKNGLQMGSAQIVAPDELLASVEPRMADQTKDVDNPCSDDVLDGEALAPWLKWLRATGLAD